MSTDSGNGGTGSPPPEQGTSTPEKPPSVASVDDFIRLARAPEWVIEGILPARSLIIFAGLPKEAKKSLTALHLTLQVAQGEPYLGRQTNMRPVMYSFLEDGFNRVGDRLRRFGMTDEEAAKRLRWRGTTSEEGFWEACNRLRVCADPVLWVVDPLVELETLHNIEDENSAVAISRMLKQYRQLAQEKGHTIIFIHHKRKEGDLMRGSGALNGATDGWWDFTPGRGGTVTVKSKLRDAHEQRFGLEIREDNRGQFVVTAKQAEEPPPKERSHRPNGDDSNDHVKVTKSARMIRDLLRARPTEFWTVASIAEEIGKHRNTVTNALQALEDMGQVEPPAGRAGEGGHGYRFRTQSDAKLADVVPIYRTDKNADDINQEDD